MKVLVLIILIGNAAGFIGQHLDIVSALKLHFRAGCIYFLHHHEIGLKESNRDFEILREFVQNGVASATLSYFTFTNYHKPVSCERNRALFILDFRHQNTESELREISGRIHMSGYKWLLFIPSNQSLSDLFRHVNVPFDCELLVAQTEDDHVTVLTEVYRVSPTLPLRTAHFGTWSPRDGLTWSPTGLYNRRNKLQGLVLNTGLVGEFDIKILKKIKDIPTEISGFSGDIWNSLKKQLGFRSQYYKPKGISYGLPQVNGSWNGMIGAVVDQEIHVAVGFFLYTKPRIQVVDYIDPIYKDGLFMFIKKPATTSLTWTNFLKPLTSGAWSLLITTFIVISVCYFVLDRLWDRSKDDDIGSQSDFKIIDALLYSYRALCLQGSDETLIQVSVRILHITTYSTALLVAIFYSGSLLSFIMSEVDILPFTNYEEFLRDGTYKMEVLKNSAAVSVFKDSSDPVFYNVYLNHMRSQETLLAGTMMGVLGRVCNRRKTATIFYEILVIASVKSLDCAPVKIPNSAIRAPTSLIIQKKSPYLGILRKTLRDMQRSGVIEIIQEKNFPRIHENEEVEFDSVTLKQVTPLLCLLLLAIALSVIIFIFEILKLKLSSWNFSRRMNVSGPSLYYRA